VGSSPSDLHALLSDAREDERRSLSRRLHDGLGQLLAALQLDLDALREHSRHPDGHDLAQGRLAGDPTLVAIGQRYGKTDAQGKFTIMTNGKPGARAGACKVTVSKFAGAAPSMPAAAVGAVTQLWRRWRRQWRRRQWRLRGGLMRPWGARENVRGGRLVAVAAAAAAPRCHL
jgi:hypothetical protein